MSDVQEMIIQVEREQKEQWIQAVAVLSTLHPTLEVNVNDPIGMAKSIHQHVTAERDTAKEIIKELVSAAQGLAASRTYNPEILRDLLARAKELLK